MKAAQVHTKADARQIILDRNLSHIKVGFFDIDGVMRGKYISQAKFIDALEKGCQFCDVVFGWDMQDQLYDNTTFTGWHSGYPDAKVEIIPDSCRDIYDEPNMLLFLLEFSGKAQEVCPRNVLKKVLEQAEDLGFYVSAGYEYEFFMFKETPDSIREKNYKNLNALSPDLFGYSMLRSSAYSELYEEILAMAATMNFPIEGLHTETGPGVLEAALTYDNALSAADKAALFKTFMKVFAQKREMMATFMAKWSSDYAGQSGHIHVSLQHLDGTSAFYDASTPHTMSSTQRHFLAGQQAYMNDFLCLVAPTINSYSRLTPDYWAPTSNAWGIENRTTALRVISGSAHSQRIEYRVGGADANPYLALSAAIASGLQGIIEQREPSLPIQGNAYDQPTNEQTLLASSLAESCQNLKQSKVARKFLGDTFVDHFHATRLWEQRNFTKQVTDWEMQRYFEII